ncbi:MAG TPA: NTP transferase domain-containing protein [Solirubrobacteraceae bacterium]|nr:NTP transferase domain-containing protein [Solirubrobacteraceae bacterium]
MRAGGIVLAGGRSSRMGTSKASLEWHGSTLLRRVVGIVARSVDGPIVVVRSAGQELPRLPATFEVVEDARADRGPLEALAAGLAALAGRAAVVFVASTDLPLLHPAFVGAVVAGIGAADDICVPVVGQVIHPLAAAYRPDRVAPAAAALLAAERLRLGLLVERCRVRRLEAAELLSDARVAAADPGLESVVNVNGPDEYRAARRRPPPAIEVLLGSGLGGAGRGGGAASVARAATLGGAAAAVGLVVGDGVVGWVNGGPADGDPELPLVAGDTVTFGREVAPAHEGLDSAAGL